MSKTGRKGTQRERLHAAMLEIAVQEGYSAASIARAQRSTSRCGNSAYGPPSITSRTGIFRIAALTLRRAQSKGEALPDSCAIVPAYRAAETVGAVVDDLTRTLGVPVFVVDDGSADDTGAVAKSRGAIVVRHAQNRGKGAALRTGLMEAARAGFRVAVTVDADGQHPAASARTVLAASDDPGALVLGVRNLVRDGAPASNRFSGRVHRSRPLLAGW